MRLVQLLFITAIITLIACKSEPKQSIDTEKMTPTQLPEPPKVLPDQIYKSTFTDGEWKVKHVSINGKMQEEDEKQDGVVKFDGEGNFSWSGDKLNHTGRWSIDTSSNVILLESSDADLTSEWTVKHKRSVMVWVGTSKYGNHSTQMMLNKVRKNDPEMK